MLDNLRNETSFESGKNPNPGVLEPAKPVRQRKTLDQITGMTAVQRLVLSVMLLAIVCMLGLILLIVLGYIVPPFI